MNQIRISQSVIEKIYEIQVNKIMRTDVIRVTPDTMMSELEYAVKKNNYACIPVLEKQKLVGQISIEGYINWWISGGVDKPVSAYMDTNFKSLHPEEPVITAVRELESVGLRGLPVVENGTNNFLGVICRCTMMEGVLAELDLNDEKEQTVAKTRSLLKGI